MLPRSGRSPKTAQRLLLLNKASVSRAVRVEARLALKLSSRITVFVNPRQSVQPPGQGPDGGQRRQRLVQRYAQGQPYRHCGQRSIDIVPAEQRYLDP